MTLTWDAVDHRIYETGIRKVALYTWNKEDKTWNTGVAWNGVTGITESPSGADETALYADDIKYLSLRSIEELGATIEAYTYPDEFKECDGSAELGSGVSIYQQPRKPFCLAYRTVVGNDTEYEEHGYKLHILYNATASPSERAYASINDSPEAITFSWELTTNPIPVDATHKDTSLITIDSIKIAAAKLKKIEDSLYGTADAEPQVLLPADIIAIINDTDEPSGT